MTTDERQGPVDFCRGLLANVTIEVGLEDDEEDLLVAWCAERSRGSGEDPEELVEKGEPEGVELDGWDGGGLGGDFERKDHQEVVP